jgi:hypothetical protein
MSDSVTIGINGTSHTVLCGFCKAPIAERVKADADTGDAPALYGCRACNNWADKDQIVQVVFQYAKDDGQLRLNRMARDAARKSKIMTFSGKTEHDTVHPFIVKLDI